MLLLLPITDNRNSTQLNTGILDEDFCVEEEHECLTSGKNLTNTLVDRTIAKSSLANQITPDTRTSTSSPDILERNSVAESEELLSSTSSNDAIVDNESRYKS